MAGLHARHPEHAFLHMLLPIFLVFLVIAVVSAQPATVQYDDCFSSQDTDKKLVISHVYAQVIPEPSGKAHLNVTLLGTTPQTIVESSTDIKNPVASESVYLHRITQQDMT